MVRRQKGKIKMEERWTDRKKERKNLEEGGRRYNRQREIDRK